MADRATLATADGRTFTLDDPDGASHHVGDVLRLEAASTVMLGYVEDVRDDDRPGQRLSGPVLRSTGEPITGRVDVQAGPTSPAEATELFAADDERLHVGVLAARPDVPVGLVGRRLNRHTFWCGQSGSGKTYALGVFLERIMSATKLPIVVFDPNSDFARLDTTRPDADEGRAGVLASRDIRILRPSSADSPLRVRFTDLSTRSKAAVLRLDPVVDRAEYNALLRLASELATSEPGAITPHLRSLGDPDADALAQRIENLGLLEWTTTWAVGGVPATEIIAERPAATVLDLGGYDRADEQLTVALGVLDDLWDRRMERRPVLLVIDEAHNLCPAQPETPLAAAVCARLVQIAAEGRKFGLWLLVSTQRPGKVHPGIVSQCDNLTLMRMNSPADLDDLARFFGFVPAQLLRQALRLRQGEALLAGGFVTLPSIVKVAARLTIEGGTDVPVPLDEVQQASSDH